MDIDELDRWLDADDDGGDGPGGDHPSGDRAGGDRRWPEAPAARGRRPRPRWLLPVVVAGGVWLAVAGLLVLGGDGEQPQDGAMAAGASSAGVVDPDLATDGMADALPATAATASEAADLPSPSAAVGPPMPDQGVLHGAAVAGLRVALTGVAGGRARYLELATPVDVQPLADGVAVVRVDAVWLEGEEGALSEARQGRWAVPVADDGTVLGPPWPVPGPPPPVPAGDPPLGTLRLDEVGPAMTAAGWTDVVAAAADPHPFLDDVVVALVTGVGPGGAVRDGDVVWLRAQEDGLVLLGAPA